LLYYASRIILINDHTGEYQDRRSQDKINCSRTIWILATNAHDPIIQEFSATNNNVLFVDADEAEKDRLMKQLSKKIKDDFLAHHGVRTVPTPPLFPILIIETTLANK
jgi:hypothetical protein